MTTTIRFTCFPQTQPPPPFVPSVVEVFRRHEPTISTIALTKGLESDPVLKEIAGDLAALGFSVETAKTVKAKIPRPVFYGENGLPSLRYDIDAYHQMWRCGLEVEAGRAILGNAIFRDLFQAMVMTDVDHLCLGIPNLYKHKSGGRNVTVRYYDKAISVAQALYGHSRVVMPYGLTIIGY
jgi:hypothetical protein